MPVEITQPLSANVNPHIFVQPLILSLMTSSNLTVGPSALAFNSNLLNIAANNQVNSTFFHSQADREKALEEVSSLLAEKLKPKPKPKAKNLSGATSSTETIKLKKNGEPAKKRGPKPK